MSRCLTSAEHQENTLARSWTDRGMESEQRAVKKRWLVSRPRHCIELYLLTRVTIHVSDTFRYFSAYFLLIEKDDQLVA